MTFMEEDRTAERAEYETNFDASDRSASVLPFGTKVRLTSIDKYGLNGRDLHPTDADIGFEGVVYKNCIGDCDGDHQENVAPGTRLPFEGYIVYFVVDSMGRSLELASWEIEILSA